MSIKLHELFSEKAVILNLTAPDKWAALHEIAEHLFNNGFINSAANFEKALVKRERQITTALGSSIAIPHAQDESVVHNVVLVAKSRSGISWDAADESPIKLIFVIALDLKSATSQTEVLAELAKIMLNKVIVAKLLRAKSISSVYKNIIENISPDPPPQLASGKKIIAITACPTGIAHTFLAAETLQTAAAELGHEIKVETQGRAIVNMLTPSDVKAADAIILAIDKPIDHLDRFNNRVVLKVPTKVAIKNARALIARALSGEGEKVNVRETSSGAPSDLSWGAFKSVYKNLMGGVSRMLPFVIAGGVLLGIAFLLDSGITGGNLGVTRDVSRWFAGLGKTAFAVFTPILGAYIANAIVGPEGLLPGFIAGFIASGGGLLYGGAATGWSNLWGGLTPGIDQDVLSAGSGFIGAMAGGYIAAVSVLLLRKYVFAKVNKNFQGIVSIIGVPILSTLLTGAAMFAAQIPLVYMAYGLKEGLTALKKNNVLWILGIIVGLMMAFDMGGPVNKAAYATATGLLANADPTSYQVMGAVMISGMVPPLAIAFSTLTFRSKVWSKKDQQAGYANWLMGAFFITEGAIPYAAQDPKRTIPSIMLGAAIAGGIMASLQVGVSAPHGGIFVFALLRSYLFGTEALQIGLGVAFALGALAVGMVAGGVTLGLWRRFAIKRGKITLEL